MTLNKINSKCPRCECKEADVLCKNYLGNDKWEVVVKCLEKKHQYTLNPKSENTEWKQFFEIKEKN